MKPKYAGKALAQVAVTGDAVVSLRPNATPPKESPRTAAGERLAVALPTPSVALVETMPAKEKRLGECSAADREKRSSAPLRMQVNEPGDEVLSNTALAGDEHLRVAWSNAFNGLPKRDHAPARGDETLLRVLEIERV